MRTLHSVMLKTLVLLLCVQQCMVFGFSEKKQRDLDTFRQITQWMKEDNVEKLARYYEEGLYNSDIRGSDVANFYTAACHFGFNLHDYRRAISIAQVGLDACDRLIASGAVDVLPGDGGVYFQRCQMLRTKAQMFAYLDEVDDAVANMVQAVNALWLVYTDPKTKHYSRNPVNGGFAITFGQILAPVFEAIKRNRGEEEAAVHLPLARAALASQAQIIHELSTGGAIMEMHAVNYRRMTAWQLGEVLLATGNATEALSVLEKAPLDKGMSPRTAPFLASFFMTKAKACTTLGRYAEARSMLEEARDGLDKAKNMGAFMSAMRWVPRYLLGQLFEAEGNTSAAVSSYLEAIEVIREIYNKLAAGNTRREYLKDSDDVYARLVRLLLKQGKTREALERLEESHGKDVLDLLGDALNSQPRQWSVESREKIRRFRKELYELDIRDKSSESTGDKRGAATREMREQVRADRQRAKAGLEKALQEARASTQVAAESSIRKTSRELLDGKSHACATLIDHATVATVIFQTRRDPCWAFVLGGGSSIAVPLNVSGAKIRAAAAKFRRAVVESEEDWKDKSAALAKLIWQPLTEPLKGKTQILLIPDGGLWYVPFAALIDTDEKPLIANRTIGICSTVHLAARLLAAATGKAKPSSQQPGKILILADPDGSLPHARTEGSDIEALAKAGGWQAETRVGSEATEIWFKRMTESTERGSLHFATHGILDSAGPLFSYLLAGPGEGEDGRLEVLEIANELDLRRFSPAVLSACNTAMGSISGGNEMICLQQAFHDAGVPDILASLWEVSDESTARLMKTFYTKLFGGTPVSQALTEAIRPMTNEPPSHWAAFQLYGVP